MKIVLMLLIVGTVIGNTNTSRDSPEQQLLKYLFDNYTVDSRPVINSSMPVHVNVTMQIIRIDLVSEKGQMIRTKLHIRQTWKNPLLEWDPEHFGGVKDIITSEDKIWTPKIHLFNEASQSNSENREKVMSDAMVSLMYDGNCTRSFATFYKSTCPIDVTFFPFDIQKCMLEFGSWVQDSRLLVLHAGSPDTLGNKEEYEENGEWEMHSGVLHEDFVKYRLSIRDHSVVRLQLDIRRKYFFYMMSLVLPCALIASMIFLVFVLPPKSGERISLGITVLLSMAIFQELSSEKLPSSSDNFPLLGIYYTISMFEIGLAMACNCFILNLYYRNYPMSSWVRRLILDKLAKVTRVHVPHARTQAYLDSVQNFSRSELSPLREIPMTSMDQNSTAIDNENNIDNTHEAKFNANMACNGTKNVSPPTRKRRALLATLKRENSNNTAQSSVSSDAMLCAKPFVATSSSILEDQKLQAEDWKLVARVLDRILLGVSVVVGVMSAFIIFLQAERFREMFS